MIKLSIKLLVMMNFVLINNVQKEYDGVKEQIKNLNT